MTFPPRRIAKPEILIVGAGPCGLTAALELRRRGFAARIIDKEPGPALLSKAVGLSPNSLAILEPSGVTERLLARGLRMKAIEARYEGDVLATIDVTRVPHRFNFMLSLPQNATEIVMEEALRDAGGNVEWNVELTALRLAGNKVEVDLSGAAGGTFDIVYAAEGAQSRVRDMLNMGFSGYTHKRTWSIVDATIPDWPFRDDAAMLALHRSGDMGFAIPIGPKRFRAASNTLDPLSLIPGTGSAVISRSDTYQIPVRQADRYQLGGVFLGGDAAHVHSPIGARGMNLGIEDASAFARRFADGTLDGYTAERHPIGQRWIVFSERLLGAVQSSNPLVIPARNLAIRTVGRLPSLQKAMLERLAGLRE